MLHKNFRGKRDYFASMPSDMEVLSCRYDLLALSSVLEERGREQKGESQANPQGRPANPL